MKLFDRWRSVRARILACVAGIAFSMLTGCAECELDLAVSKQGAAVMTVQAVAAPEDLDRIKPLVPTLRAMGMDMSLTEALLAARIPSKEIPPAAFENFARMFGPKLQMDGVTRTSVGRKTGVRAVFRAARVSDLYWSSSGQAGDRVGFHFVPGRAAIFRILPPAAADAHPTSGQKDRGSIQALDKLLGAALAPLRARVTVTVDGQILQTSAARKSGASSVVVAQADGRRMGLDTLMRMSTVKSVGDIQAIAERPPAGVFLENPVQPLVIRFE
ncbi:MAG: hypothetical protein KBA51_03300 [Kiritimatiellae bacterium]|nr:hypothetical protein [Kiritimatiellia bacterium]